MTVVESYQLGWKKVWKNKKMWVLLYLLNFVFALLGSVPFSGFLSKSLGNTLATSNMLNGFDYTFISDLMREYGSGLNVIMNLSIGIVLLFFIFSIFWMGGILSILKNEEADYSFQKFWQGSALYFWKLIRLTIYFSFFQIVLLSVFAFIFISMGISPFEVKSELEIIWRFIILFPIYLFLATVLFMIQDYAKIHILYEESSWITSSIKNAFKFVAQNFGKCLGLYLLNIITFLIFFLIYWILSNSFDSNTSLTILMLFIIGQAFIFSRIAVKLLNLGSAIAFFNR